MREEDKHYKETRQKYTTRKKFKRKYREYLWNGMSENISLTSEVGDISYHETAFDLLYCHSPNHSGEKERQ
jgi:hypothetical protein